MAGKRGQGGKGIDPDDAALWADMMEDVTPLPGRVRPPAATPATETPPAPRKIKKLPSPRPPAVPPAAPAPTIGSGLDHRSRDRLERGKMEIEATLDLHGHNRDAGRAALTAFLLDSWHAGRRCVLVITGKGRLTRNDEKPWWDSERGVLKSGFSQWINEPPLDRVVLHTSLARGHHGGGGAFYVLLRRDRG